MIKTYLKETAKYILRSGPFIRKYVDEVESLYAMSPEQLRERNNRRFLEIFRKAYDRSPFYHSLYTAAGIGIDDIRSIDDIHKLPVVTKEMVRTHGKELLTRNARGLIENRTSGTSGSRLCVYEDWPSIWREQAYFIAYRRRCGYNYGDPMVSLRGTLDGATFSMKLHASNTLYLSSLMLRDELAERYMKAIEGHRPKAIEGYPSTLYNLAIAFRRKGMRLHVPVAFTSSETMYDFQREVIEEVFGCKVFDHYGTTERTLRLEELPGGRGYFEDPGYGIAEYRDDCVIATSLINDAFPLIRYVTDDTFEPLDSNDPAAQEQCGTFPAPAVKKPFGRNIAFLVAKDGTRISNVSLTFVFKVEVRNLDKAQFVQKEKGKIDFNLVANGEIPPEDIRRLVKSFTDRVGEDKFDITVNIVSDDRLRYSSRNKFALVISDLPADERQ